MTQRLIPTLALAAAFCAGYFAAMHWTPVTAQAQAIPPQRTVSVPRPFGNFRGTFGDQLLFEDERGTIRSVYPNGGSVIFTVVRK